MSVAFEEKMARMRFYAAVEDAAADLADGWAQADLEARRRVTASRLVAWVAGLSLGGIDGLQMMRIVKRVAEMITEAERLEIVEEDLSP